MRKLILPLLFLLAFGVGARPAAPPIRSASPGLEKWTVDDVVLGESIGGPQVSPDGRWATWAKTSPDKDKNEFVVQLFRTDLASGRTVQLTRGTESCWGARWSPDGRHLAFLSGRAAPRSKSDDKEKGEDDKTQIWLLDPTGGEPWPVTELAHGVARYGWAGPNALVFAAQEGPTRRESRLKEDKDTTVVVEDDRNEPPVRLFKVDAKSKKVTRLSENKDRIEQLAVSPDGKYAVAVHSRSLRYVYDNKTKPVVYLYDLAAGSRRPIFSQPKYNVGQVRWAPDGHGVYATHEHSSQPQLNQAGVTELHYYDLARQSGGAIDLAWPRGLATQTDNEYAAGFVPVRDGFLALLADGVRHRPARYRRKGAAWERQWLTGAHARNLFGLQAGVDGKALLYAHSTASSPTQWYRARLNGAKIEAPAPLPETNDHFKKRAKAKTEVVRWRGGLGDEVDGILYYPHDYKPGRRAPLVVLIHGGPASADFDSWEESWAYASNLLCQRGAFVLKPNYHGSSNYGLKWLESIAKGKYCEPEIDDIEKGVDALIRRGLVDGDRLGLGGWSNGAILTNVLVTRTTRYKAAVAGAGTVEYVSDWASCEFGEAFDRFYLGKSPLEDLGLFVRKSPFYRFDRVKTPSLIFFGSEDRVVAAQQGWLHYRGLQQLGKVPVRFVMFPGEKHSLKKIGHQRRKLQEELAWFDKHLFGKEKKEDEGLKPDSPLAWALKLQAAKRVGNRYGLLEKGKLVPETVKQGALHVGRFEVTRAQFAEFDRKYALPAGRANYPASGIGFEQAGAYCAWLSKTMGRRYRLPTEEEAEDLYEKPESGENTLDAWAGYTVNPDDALRLRALTKKLPGPAALLKEVGSGRGTGQEELAFDLGGNVAEWVRGKNGKGLMRGGSADLPADAKGGLEAGPEYRGLRVVLER